MTGISDVYRNAKQIYKRSKRWWRALASRLPQPMGRALLKRLPAADNESESLAARALQLREVVDVRGACQNRADTAVTQQQVHQIPQGPFRWGLLVPICSYNSNAEECFSKLTSFRDSLQATCREPKECTVHLGIDKGDPAYGDPEAKERLRGLFCAIGIQVEIHMFGPAYHGRLCWIWDELAQKAVHSGADFFVLLGDDIQLHTEDWQREIEQQFVEIARRRALPFGVACVAFRDVAFRAFPTFPVLHRQHLQVFGRLFPKEFINQHGDPFVFEIYRRWGASEFAARAALSNTVGGAEKARYRKHSMRIHWRDTLLTSAIETLATWLRAPPQFTCIDVVCPTYRCDVPTLQKIAALETSPECKVSTQVLFVVDNPSIAHLEDLKALEQWTANKVVRVYVNLKNLGASESRNAGHAQSFGDYVVFLDDDVDPEPKLLEAYFGAVRRHPDAKVWVGVTKVPAPQTLMQHALAACQMTFFYNVAERMPNPPWGVTANICVRGRTQNEVWFSDAYPRTGGGEDIDYCLRQKPAGEDRDRAIVAVPGAVAYHPFWSNILSQVAGWASGDVKCLEALPHSTFYTAPNWAETILLLMLCHLWSAEADTLIHLARSLLIGFRATVVVVLVEVFMTFPSLRVVAHGRWWASRQIIKVLGCLPCMVQDVVRLRYKLVEFKFYQICLRFDWMDGQGQHSSVEFVNELYKLVVRGLALRLANSGQLMGIFEASGLLIVMFLLMSLWCISQSYDDVQHLPDEPAMFPALNVGESCGPTPFVVLAYQRTGSNLLCGILHNHHQVLMHNEIFDDRRVWSYFPKEAFGVWDINKRNKDPVGFLNAIFGLDIKGKSNPLAVGFKLFPEHWDRAPFDSILRDPRVKKIILRRRSRLQVIVSMLRANSLDAHVGKDLDPVEVRIEPKELQSFAEHYDAWYAKYEQLCQGGGPENLHFVTYEDLVSDRQAEVIRSLLQFLGVAGSHVPEPLKETRKQSSLPMNAVVTNFDELETVFRHARGFENDFGDAA